ncbi:MAG: L,D-transpeptidase [Alphaproteobacteria bacterium]
MIIGKSTAVALAMFLGLVLFAAAPAVAFHSVGSGGSSLFGSSTRTTVSYQTKQRPGTIIVNTKERRLYYVLKGGKAIRYMVGVGRQGFAWKGTNRITRKAEWPSWTPPPAMRKREPWLPVTMKGGKDNPLGARALYLGNTLYRLHGTSNRKSVGQAVSSGCIRMMNEDVIDLYGKAKIGTKVIVL